MIERQIFPDPVFLAMRDSLSDLMEERGWLNFLSHAAPHGELVVRAEQGFDKVAFRDAVLDRLSGHTEQVEVLAISTPEGFAASEARIEALSPDGVTLWQASHDVYQ